MNILLVGKSETGKSNLGDVIRNILFRIDGNAIIHNSDPDREINTFGKGGNAYNIHVKQLKPEESLSDVESFIDELEIDMIVHLNGPGFSKWFEEIYT